VFGQWQDNLLDPCPGPAVTPNQVGPRRFATRGPIANLYLAGAGVMGDGVAPYMLSGQLAAAAARSRRQGKWVRPEFMR